MNLRYYKSKYFVLLVLAIAAVCTWLAEIGIPQVVMKYLSPASCVAVFLLCFDKWLWKCPVFSWFMTVPDISGNYTGQIEFVYNEKRQSKKCKMEIKQTSTRVNVKTLFIGDDANEPSTSSCSLVAAIVDDERKGNLKLVFVYENQGSYVAGDTLTQHYGTNVLNIIINKKTIELDGYYYTNRKPNQTMGAMKVSKQKN